MNQNDPLFHEAMEYAEIRSEQAAELEAELHEAQQEVDRVKAQLETARQAHQRLSTYEVFRDHDRQCYRCWIDLGEHSALKPKSSENPGVEDLFQCRTCGYEHVQELGRAMRR